MTDLAPRPSSGDPPPLNPVVRNSMVGCLTFVVGFFGGAMIAVLLAKMVDFARKCTPSDGLPACNWHIYWLIGGAIGAVGLPTVVLMKLARGDAARRHSA